MARKPRKPTKDSIKAAAARAEATSRGEAIVEPVAPITPPIVPAEEIIAAAKRGKGKKRRKRRVLYSAPLAKALCTLLARGHTLTSICRRPAFPREDVVLRWASDPSHPFSDRYARAREVGYLRMADQLVDIADDSTNDFMLKAVDKDGGVVMGVNREVLERTRLRIDTRKWLLAKALPKIYGEKVAVDHGGKVEQVHSEAPQPTGDDHMAHITQRYMAKVPGSKENAGSKSKANGSVH